MKKETISKLSFFEKIQHNINMLTFTKRQHISDGYHTFAELYDFRMMYNSLLFNEWAKYNKYDVHKSLKHHDGELCFGGKYFVVCAMLPTGQITNHYSLNDWDLFNVPVTDTMKYEYDGHTSEMVLERMKNLT